MFANVVIYSDKKGELNKFLSSFYNSKFDELENSLTWNKKYDNPIEIAEIISAFGDNYEDYTLHMWINLDTDLYINIDDKNVDNIIKYLYERYPY